MEINLKKIRIINVTLSICVALVMSGIVMDFQFMGERRDLSRPGGGEQKAAPSAPVRAASDFTENEVILKGGLMAPGGRLLYMRDKPRKKSSNIPAVSSRTVKAPNGNLSLKGTIVSDIGKSIAIFEEKRSKRQELIYVGGDVFGAGKITVIDEDRVLVAAAGGITHEYSMDFGMNGKLQARAAGNIRRGRPGAVKGNGIVAKTKWAEELKMMRDMQHMNDAVGHHGGDPVYDDADDDAGDNDASGALLDEASLPGASVAFITPSHQGGSSDAGLLASLIESPPASKIDWWDVYDALGSGTGDSLTYVSYDSYPSGDPVSGFMLSEIHDGLFSLIFDLAAGDVITKVNETPLDSPEAWLRVSNGLWNAPNIRLSILRGGIVELLDFELR